MVDFENKTNVEISAKEFELIRRFVCPQKSLELILVSDEEIKEINREYRGLDKATDVLSFPIKGAQSDFIGSALISVDTAQRAANELGVSLETELKVLFIHGLLHLLGYDHEMDNGQMRAEEQRIADALGIKNALIVRNEL